MHRALESTAVQLLCEYFAIPRRRLLAYTVTPIGAFLIIRIVTTRGTYEALVMQEFQTLILFDWDLEGDEH